jgi:FKBP-type peptidyl-prolyl cis-trans isomerase FklB
MFRDMKDPTNRRLLNGRALLMLSAFSAAAAGQAPSAAEDASYTFGLNMGQQLHQSGVTNEISLDRLVAGVKDGLAGKSAMPGDQQQLQAFLRSVLAAKEFLERNRKESGVKTTATGLQYRIIESGNTNGAPPRPGDKVKLQYRGTFIDGTEFDSSSKHPSAAPIAVNNFIEGWQEALALMKPKARWQLFVPPELAYGRGARPGIPGGSLLIFDIELKSILAASPPPAR